MQLIADILKRLSDENKISKKDLYELKESDGKCLIMQYLFVIIA